MMSDITGSTIFDEDAGLYDSVRPSYPVALVDDVFAYSDIEPSGRILEVGCGTGQATFMFAEHGNPMLCIEPGPSLAAIAHDKARPYSNVQFVVSRFEDWAVEAGVFDLVISATAFHWIQPDIGFPKAADALRDSGTIALFWNKHPGPYSAVFQEMNEEYRIHAPESSRTEVGGELEVFSESIRQYTRSIEDTHLFGEISVKQYPWSQKYDTQHYLRLLDTYSDHRRLPEYNKRRLYEGIAQVIERHGGMLVKEYVSVLYLARKQDPRSCR